MGRVESGPCQGGEERKLTDVHENALDLGLGEHNLERLLDSLSSGSSSDVEEV